MSDDGAESRALELIASTAGSSVDKFNLPKLLLGPAVDAAQRLLGGLIDAAAGVHLENHASGERAKQAGKNLFTMGLAEAALKNALQNEQLIDAATNNFLGKEYRRFNNKSKVVVGALQDLGRDANDQTAGPVPRNVAEDWLNVFERYAEDASSEFMQTMWSKVLSREIRSPKAVSLQTLRFMSELDHVTAQYFQQVAPYVLNDFMLPSSRYEMEGESFVLLRALSEAGLISGVGDNNYMKISSTQTVKGVAFTIGQITLHCTSVNDFNFQIPCFPLTRVGSEVVKIIDREINDDHIQAAVESINQWSFDSIIQVNPDGSTKVIKG